jgi:hypothetical protein
MPMSNITYDLTYYSKNVNSKEYAYSQLSASKLKHTIINPLNNLLKEELLKLAEIDEFRSWAVNNRISLDWRQTLYLLIFIQSKKISLSQPLISYLMGMAASQWTYCDKTSRSEIFIFHKDFDGFIIQAKKSFIPWKPREIYALKKTSQINFSSEGTLFFSLTGLKGNYENIDKY